MKVEIRRATSRDVPAQVALMAAFYAEAAFPLPLEPATRAFETLLADPHVGGAWLAHVDGAPIGHVVLTVCFSMEYGGLRGFIDDLYVQPAARGRGTGAALLAVARAAALERGVRALRIGFTREQGISTAGISF